MRADLPRHHNTRRRHRRITAAAPGLAMMLGLLVSAMPAAAQQAQGAGGAPPEMVRDRVLHADLADGLGKGSFTAVIAPRTGRMCYLLNVFTYEPATAAHIHVGGKGQDGAVSVPLATPVDGASGECLDLPADTAQALLANPGGYYVNVHTASFPKGAVRGQLEE